MPHTTLEILTSPGCHQCKVFKEFWHTVEKDWPDVSFREVDVTTPEGQEMAQKYMIFASPGVIINGELLSTGGFDKDKLLDKLREASRH
jgi:glutaredoxin